MIYDNTVTGITDGALAWYDDDEVRYLIDSQTPRSQVNLLTNSGFGVWSNSEGLYDPITGALPTGEGLITGWTNNSYDTFTSTAGAITSAITDGSGAAPANSDTFTTVAGKLYEITVTLTLNSGTAPRLYTTEGDGSGAESGLDYPIVLSAGANTFVYEADVSGSAAYLQMYNTAAASNWSATFSLHEVTPGIVGANALGPDGWIRTAWASAYPDIYRQHNDGGTFTKDGSFYSLKFVGHTTDDTALAWPGGFHQNDEWEQKFAGRTVTFGCWVKSSVASKVKLGIGDGSWSYGDLNSGTGWEWLEFTDTVQSTPTRFQVQVYVTANAGTAVTAYISQPQLSFGSSIGEGNYVQPPGEIVWCENNLTIITNYTLPSPVMSINTESISNGKIPKGIKTVWGRIFSIGGSAPTNIQTMESTNYYVRGFQVDNNSVGGYVSGIFIQPTDSNGDFVIYASSADFTFTEVRVNAVQVAP